MKRHILTILTSVLLVTGTASLAFADNQCAKDADCGVSEVCVEVTSGCPPPCRPGDDNCEPFECNPGKSRMCQPGPPSSCETDQDCSGGLVCVTTTQATCNGGGADPAPCEAGDSTCNPQGDAPEPSNCVETSESLCMPPYMAPCTDDASCGAPGFTCEAVPVSCGCTTPAPGPGETDGGEPAPACECPEPDETNRHCELAVLPCQSDNDCSNDFICHHNAGPAPDVSCSSDSETGEPDCEPNTTTPDDANNEGRCAPADFRDWAGGNPKGEEPTTDTGGSTDGPDTGSTPGGSTSNEGTPNATPPNQNDADSNGDGELLCGESDSCHIASLNTGKTSTTALLLAGAAAFFTFRRRRKN